LLHQTIEEKTQNNDGFPFKSTTYPDSYDLWKQLEIIKRNILILN